MQSGEPGPAQALKLLRVVERASSLLVVAQQGGLASVEDHLLDVSVRILQGHCNHKQSVTKYLEITRNG